MTETVKKSALRLTKKIVLVNDKDNLLKQKKLKKNAIIHEPFKSYTPPTLKELMSLALYRDYDPHWERVLGLKEGNLYTCDRTMLIKHHNGVGYIVNVTRSASENKPVLVYVGQEKSYEFDGDHGIIVIQRHVFISSNGERLLAQTLEHFISLA